MAKGFVELRRSRELRGSQHLRRRHRVTTSACKPRAQVILHALTGLLRVGGHGHFHAQQPAADFRLEIHHVAVLPFKGADFLERMSPVISRQPIKVPSL